MRVRSAGRGEGKAGCIFWVAVLAAFSYIAYQAVPAKVDISDLEEFMVRQAETAGRSSEQQIRDAILARARDLGLPVTKDNLVVDFPVGRIIITCDYEIPISLLVYTYHWKIEHRIDRPVFVI
jgi:hypothetical protein